MSLSPKILLVEDEETLADVISLNLELEQYEIEHSSDGQEASILLKENSYDLVILDVMLPKIDGFDLCAKFRTYNKVTPVLFLSAKNQTSDRINGLKLGADDYLVKPFDLEELLLRVKILLHRKSGLSSPEEPVYQFGEFEINFETFQATILNKEKIDLSKKETNLLRLLTSKENQVVSRDEILDAIWNKNTFPSSRTIDNYILVFRKYFENAPKTPKHFHSIRGVGYKFTR